MPWIEILHSKLPLTGPPERRSDSQIENDLDDEFAFHLDMKTRDLINEGHERDAARGLARSCFGNLETIKQQCKRIALEERIMLQRVNCVMMIVVLIMVVVVGIQVFMTQRYNTLALQGITAQLAKMQAGWLTSGAASASSPGVVYLDGDVPRPGVYQLPALGALTVRRAIAAAGGVKDNRDAAVTVTKIGPGGAPEVVFQCDGIKEETASDFVLAPDHHVEVVQKVMRQAAPASGAEGATGRVLIEGEIATPGWQEISLTTGTTVEQMLRHLGVRPEQWVTYRRSGATSAQPALAIDFLEPEQPTVLRPNDEILVQDDVAIESRRTYFSRQLRFKHTPSYWVAHAEDGIATFHLGFREIPGPGRLPSSASTLVREGSSESWFLQFQPQGLSIQDYRKGLLGDWDMRDGRIILDFTNLRERSRDLGVMVPQPQPPLAGLVLRFEPAASDQAFHQAQRAAAIADAVEREVIGIFGSSEDIVPDRPDLDEFLGKVLDQSENRIVPKDITDAVVAERIRELFKQGRARLEADAAWRQGATTEARGTALRRFLTQLLLAADPSQGRATPGELLDHVSKRVEDSGRDAKSVAQIRQAIAKARSELTSGESKP